MFPEFLSCRSTWVVGDTQSSSLLLFNVTGINLPLPVFYRLLNSITFPACIIKATQAIVMGRTYELRL